MIIYNVIHSHKFGIDLHSFKTEELAEEFILKNKNLPHYDDELEFLEISINELREESEV